MFEPESNLPSEDTFRFVETPDSVGGYGEEYKDGDGEGGNCTKSCPLETLLTMSDRCEANVEFG